MSITTGMTATHLTRSQLWQNELKEQLLDSLDSEARVRWISEFGDGDNLTIPSIGEASVRDYEEDTAIKYDSLDSGEFKFNITEYKSSGLYITEKARQDAYYAAQLEASFVPKQARAMGENLESDILSVADATNTKWAHKQTKANPNEINGASHRFRGGSSSSGVAGQIEIADFAKALYALKRANVPDQSLIAIVDPSVEYMFNTLSEVVSIANPTPQWDAINQTGIANGMRFIRNLYGFDIYVSNYLSQTSEAEPTLGYSTAGVAGDVNNIFFSAASPDILPFIGAWRQMPKVDSEYNKDFQREEYVTTARYGLDLYRPENLVSVLTSPTIS